MVEARPTTLTYEDYAKTPDDERWELLRGEMFMVPSPHGDHQRVISRLDRILAAFVEEQGLGEIFIAPFDVVLSDTTVLQPDVLFVAAEQSFIFTGPNIQGSPALVIEVASPSTESRDQGIKKSIYAEHGVGEYWLVDPEARSITVLSLHGDKYRESGSYRAGDVLTSPTLAGLELDLGKVFPNR